MLSLSGYAAIAALILVPIESVPLRFLLFVFSFYAIQLTAVVFHEFGHFLACLVLGELPVLVQIGTGRMLAQLRFGPVTVRFGATTNSGFVLPKHHFENFSRANMLLLYAAGPVVDLLIAGSIMFFLIYTPEDISGVRHFDGQVKPLLIMTAVYVFYYQLWYLFNRSSYEAGHRSDAGGLTSLWPVLNAPDPVRRAYVWMLGEVDPELFNRSFADEDRSADQKHQENDKATEPIHPGWRQAKLGRSELLDLQECYRWLLAQPNVPEDYADEIKDSFVTNVLLFDIRELLPIAEQYSDELLTKDPENLTLLGTRGSVLVALGQIDAGMRMLQRVYASSHSLVDRSISASFLAIAEQLSGNSETARLWLEKAVTADPDCPAVRRAQLALEMGTFRVQ